VSAPCFSRVRATARRLLLETEGDERDRDALGVCALALLDSLPEDVEAACWRKQRRDCDRLNRFLNEGIAPGSSNQEPRQRSSTRSPDSIGEVRRLRSPAPRRRERPPAARHASGDPFLGIPATVYSEALTGREVGRDSKVRCPFHDDHTPSLHAYNDPLQGWFCFGCGRGGDIYTFAGLLWEIEPRGAGYHEICRRLEAELLPALRRVAA
jgi:hypothetical protein